MTLAHLGLPSLPPDHGTGTTLWLSLVIGGAFELHILTSGLISAGGQVGPVVELIGWMRRRPAYERLARGIGKTLVLYFAISSALAFLLITVLLVGMAGTFWTTITRITFWPLTVELFAFLFEVALAYLWYYTWDTLSGRFKPLHLAIGGLLILDDFLQVLMINVVASYMLTPGLPSDPIKTIINPSFYDLQVHRIDANIAYLGFFVAAVAAWKFRRARADEDRAYWDWAGSLGVLIGVLLTLMQPMIGYSYAKEIQLSSYGAWYNMMLGDLSNVFLLQIILLGLMFLAPTLYFARRLRTEGLRGHHLVSLLGIGLILSTIFAGIPYQIGWTYQDVQAAGLAKPVWDGGRIIPFASMLPWKVIALVAYSVLALWAVIWYLRGMRGITWGRAGRGEQRMLTVAAILTALMIVTMGFIREHGRSPDLIYGEMGLDQTTIAGPPSAPPAPP